MIGGIYPIISKKLTMKNQSHASSLMVNRCMFSKWEKFTRVHIIKFTWAGVRLHTSMTVSVNFFFNNRDAMIYFYLELTKSWISC